MALGEYYPKDWEQLYTTGHISADFIIAGTLKSEDFKMGYMTRFNMSFRGSAEDKESFVNFYRNGQNNFGSYELNPLDSDEWEEMKWYDHDEDVLELSKQWPTILIMLEGYGEDDGDIWKCYYKNGKIWRTKANIRFDEPPEGYFE